MLVRTEGSHAWYSGEFRLTSAAGSSSPIAAGTSSLIAPVCAVLVGPLIGDFDALILATYTQVFFMPALATT